MNKRMFALVLSFTLLLIWLGPLSALEKPSLGEPVTVTGKIGFRERSGGYYLMGENPPSVLIIVNQDPRILEVWFKNAKPVTVEGHLAGGADLLFIEKIDGKPYAGPQVNK
jgi:hypothetical protein